MKELRGKSFWITLLIGFFTFIFVNGSYNVDLLALIAPVFFLLITRNSSRVSDFVLVALAIGFAGIIKYPDIFWMGFPYDQASAFVISLVVIIPIIADSFIYKGFTKNGSYGKKFAATFIFPTIFAVLEEICSWTVLGTTLAMSVTQNNNLPLMEIASVVGQFGLAFLVTWIPSFIYYLIDVFCTMKQKSALEFFKIIKKPLVISLVAFMAICTYGELRLCLKPTSNNYVEVAFAHGTSRIEDSNGNDVLDDLGKLKKALSEQTQTAAKNGAKLLCFNEEAFYISQDNLTDFLEYAKKVSKENQIYSLVGIETTSSRKDELPRNVAVLVSSKGEIVQEYDKSRLIPFMELGVYQQGDGEIPIIPIELAPNTTSLISTAICYEGEFNSYINQIYPETDIHLNPSYEWMVGSEYHNNALQLRSIEHGMSVIEPTVTNTSTIFDCLGKVVATSSTTTTGFDTVTFGNIPAQGIYTIYILGGYILDFLYIPVLITFIVLAIKGRRRREKNKIEVNVA